MLEELINLKVSMRKKEPKSIVYKKFLNYSNAYDELAGQKTIRDKLEYRDLKNRYTNYMRSSKEKGIIF